MEGKMQYMKPAIGSMEDFHGFFAIIIAVFSVAAAAVGAIAYSASTQMNKAASQRRASQNAQRRSVGFSILPYYGK
jgi:hypothetical protein